MFTQVQKNMLGDTCDLLRKNNIFLVDGVFTETPYEKFKLIILIKLADLPATRGKLSLRERFIRNAVSYWCRLTTPHVHMKILGIKSARLL